MIPPSSAILTDALTAPLVPGLSLLPDSNGDPSDGIGSMNLFSQKVEPRANQESGRGLFAVENIAKGELIAVWGGRITTARHFHDLPEEVRKLSLQIEEECFLVPQGGENAADYINHSCDPNAGMSGQIIVVAMRDISVGEEICYDYAMSDGSGYDEFPCACGARNCRGQVTGQDWMRRELWKRYDGFFSPYLARRIRAIKNPLRRNRQVSR